MVLLRSRFPPARIRARRCGRPLALSVSLLLGLALASPASSAGALTIQFDRASYSPGDSVNLSVAGAAVDEYVALEVDDGNGTATHFDLARADTQGHAYFDFRLPLTAATGLPWTAFVSSPSASGNTSFPVLAPAPPLPPPPLPPVLTATCGSFETGTYPNCVFVVSRASISPAAVAAGAAANVSMLLANPASTPLHGSLVVQLVLPDGTALPPAITSLDITARAAVSLDLPVLVPADASAGAGVVQVQLLSALPSERGEALFWTSLDLEVSG